MRAAPVSEARQASAPRSPDPQRRSRSFRRQLVRGPRWQDRLGKRLGQVVRAAPANVPGFLSYLAALGLALGGRIFDGGDAVTVLSVLGIWATLLWRVSRRLWLHSLAPPRIGGAANVEDELPRMARLELGLAFVAATMCLVSLLGGVSGPMYPLVFALTAYFAAFSRVSDAAVFLLALIGLEAAITFSQPWTPRDVLSFISHLSWCGFFAVLYALFLRTDLAQRRRETAQSIRRKLAELYNDARDYRLVGALHSASADGGAEDAAALDAHVANPSGASSSVASAVDAIAERRRIFGSVAAVREALYNLLAVAEKALAPNVLAVYALDVAGEKLKLKEVRGAGDDLRPGPIAAREGVFGGILTKKAPLVLTNLGQYRGLVYYREGAQPDVHEFVGVPLIEGQYVRGVLLADRLSGQPFEGADLALLETLAKEVVRTLEVERLFSEMDRERRSRERFFRASQAFSAARTTGEVADAALQSASYLCEPALTVLTTFDDSGAHIVRTARGSASVGIREGTSLDESSALVASALKQRAVLPLPGVPLTELSLFGRAQPTPVFSAARVFPLVARGEPIGTWVVALAKGQLAPDVESMLGGLSHQVATSCANARMNETMERMATTDALTSLYNRRAFTQILQERFDICSRYGRKLSVIVCDIDHFKSVNDTYGHPVGDIVLKAVSRLLAGEARKTDAVGRLGGEEFAVVMEETDTRGARLMAERMRERVMNEVVRVETGKLQVTLSLGIATFPDDGKSADLLISRADEALYRAKHGGRNRTVAFSAKSAPT